MFFNIYNGIRAHADLPEKNTISFFMLCLDMSVTVQLVKKMDERFLIVVNYCFSNAPPSNIRKMRALFVTYVLEPAYRSLAPLGPSGTQSKHAQHIHAVLHVA